MDQNVGHVRLEVHVLGRDGPRRVERGSAEPSRVKLVVSGEMCVRRGSEWVSRMTKDDLESSASTSYTSKI